jgi:hypothetical protein
LYGLGHIATVNIYSEVRLCGTPSTGITHFFKSMQSDAEERVENHKEIFVSDKNLVPYAENDCCQYGRKQKKSIFHNN